MDKITITPQNLMSASIKGVQAVAKEFGVEVTEDQVMKNLHPSDLAQIAAHCTNLVETLTGKQFELDRGAVKEMLFQDKDKTDNFKDSL